jgi:hypothetical protein
MLNAFIILECVCSHGRKKGKLFITPHYVCFLAKFFGHKIKEKLLVSEITNLQLFPSSATIVITTNTATPVSSSPATNATDPPVVQITTKVARHHIT